MMMIVGLGNQGTEYENTRHNVGFIAVDWLAQHWQAEGNWRHAKQQAYIRKLRRPDVILVKPTTMMNQSGQTVQALIEYYKIDISNLIVIHDDADLEVGVIKTIGSTTSGAGHHGILSVIEHVGPGFKRIRIGIGRPHQTTPDISTYVLGHFSPKDKALIAQSIQAELEYLIMN